MLSLFRKGFKEIILASSCLIMAVAGVVGCKSNKDDFYKAALVSAIDSLFWVEAYHLTGWGNAEIDSVKIYAPYRIKYSYKGRDNSTFNLYQEGSDQEISQLIMAMYPQDNNVTRFSSLDNAKYKILADNSTKWSICIEILNDPHFEIDSLVAKGEISLDMIHYRDSLLKEKIHALNSDIIDYTTTRNALKEWQLLGVTNCAGDNASLFERRFHLQGGPFKVTGWYDIPFSYKERWNYDLSKLATVDLINHTNKTTTRLFSGQYGRHSINYEDELPEGIYSINTGWVGEIYFEVLAYQE